MALNGQLSFNIASGTPGAVTATGSTLSDGTYTITIVQDASGYSLAVVTPYGATGQTGFTKGDDIE